MNGSCDRVEGCRCVAEQLTLRAFCNHFRLEEQPPGTVEAWSIENWNRVPEPQRTACVARLMLKVPKAVRQQWADQVKRGMRIGSDQVRFHFSVGMSVRNTLREVIADDLLPPTRYPDGSEHRNWDDYYYGAPDELARSVRA